VPAERRRFRPDWALARQRARRFRPHPAQFIFGGFAAVAFLGSLLLTLPMAKTGQGAATWIDSIFTAVSALCVTGLTVVDTATYWTPFGHVVILLLMQVGGLGVMTFASFIGIVVARRLSYRTQLTAAAEVHSTGVGNVKSLIVGVIRISFAIEAVVAAILTAQFAIVYRQPFGEALWSGVFHAVSSFNNAGFVLFRTGMEQYAQDPVITLTLSFAVILGGLGFPVLVQLRREFLNPLLWSMNTRLVLVTSLFLVVAGTILITALEWSNPATLGGLSWPQRLLAGFFQSVQTRSGGFNTVDISQLHGATLLGMDALMFIGGGPAGTSGGIKVTTFGVLFFIVLAEVRGDGVVNVLGKRLSRAVHRQAISVVVVAVGVVIAATASLMVITGRELGPILFETISAFATVGLSTGITPDIPAAGQFILVLLMFVGRLGPITFASAIALRQRGILYQLPKERPIIG
jgi:trk system potassium uptake protein TrkH